MSTLIAPVLAPSLAPVAAAAGPASAGRAAPPAGATSKRAEKLKEAAHDFESLLVKQFLKASKIGGESKSGYGDMAVDALADGIERGGGLGLAARIEEALRGGSR